MKESGREGSRRVDESEKSETLYCGEWKEHHFVRRFPGFARSSF
jgi:hypothetical protein